MYQTTAVGRMHHKVVGGEGVTWRQAPSGAWYGFDDDQVAEGPAAGSRLEIAKAAGMAALAEGYGSPRLDGLVPCGHCPACDAGYPASCRRPRSKAEARLRAAQQRDDDRGRQRAEGRAMLAEL
jgi:hypothetical protein